MRCSRRFSTDDALRHHGFGHGAQSFREIAWLPAEFLADGLLEMRIDLGEAVEMGDTIALVHDVKRSSGEPVRYQAAVSGILAGRHFPGLIAMADCLAVIAVAD